MLVVGFTDVDLIGPPIQETGFLHLIDPNGKTIGWKQSRAVFNNWRVGNISNCINGEDGSGDGISYFFCVTIEEIDTFVGG